MSILEIALLVILSPVIIVCSAISVMLLIGIVLAVIDGFTDTGRKW